MADDAIVPTPAQALVSEDDPQWKKNLKPIKPGEVRNPLGRSGAKWQQQFREFFDAPAEEPEEDGTTASRFLKVCQAIYLKALKGSDAAQKVVVEQMAGKAALQVNVGGPDGEKLETGVDAITATLRAALAARQAAATNDKPAGDSGE